MNMKRNVFLMFLFCALASLGAFAAVVARPAPSRATNSSRMPTLAKQPVTVATPETTATSDTVAETVDTTASEPEVIVENKSEQFAAKLGDTLSSNPAGTDLAEQIRAQRAALDMADIAATNNAIISSAKNSCDANLRECMTEKCGTNFTKCASDTDTLFGVKLDSCRRNLKCTANEFKLLSAEIKADRNATIKLKSFNDIIDCGQSYDKCIIGECGTTYAKCLSKSAGDKAISKCATIAKKCVTMDSGLASRTMSVFATLRQTAEKQISSDEKKLYALRDQMKSVCSRLGAMFDERSLDCVYTVNFYAGENSTLFASKKAYAGATFDCTPNWFGVDVTTYRENADRETRAQTSASSAMLGSGVGTAVGALTSGAFDRAISRQNADDAVKKAECEKAGKNWNSFLGTCSDDKTAEKAQKKAERNQEKEPINSDDNHEQQTETEKENTEPIWI